MNEKKTDGQGVNESLLGIITGAAKKIGIVKQKRYHIVVTDQRIVFAEITKAMVKEDQKKLVEETKGKGFMARMKIAMQANQIAAERFENMSIEEILQMSSENFAVHFSTVKKIKTPLGVRYDQNEQEMPKKVDIISEQGTHSLRFDTPKESNHAYKLLKDAHKQSS